LKILFFTGSRATYYLMRPLIKKLLKYEHFEISIIVSGGIVIEKSQKTLNDIKSDGINILGELSISSNNDNHAYTIGELCLKILPKIKKFSPDLAIVYADRYEAFSFAIAVSHSDIPLLHLEAGDITEGGTHDDQVRHCISKLSHLFCTSTLLGCEIIKGLGEESWRSIHSGLISYDDMKSISEEDRNKVRKQLMLREDEGIILATMHPIPKNLKLTKNETEAFLEALVFVSNKIYSKIILTSPNNDQGNYIISDLIETYLPNIKNSKYVESLGGKSYHSIMSLASERNIIVCGNSSSIIKEAPFFGAHSLNIGSRQLGRESASTQVNSKADKNRLISHLNKLSRTKCKKGFNPYFKDNSSEVIIEFIKKIFKTYTKEEILFKRWNR
tara:strand:- start:1391 stop:2551 length:1161 start_codon:yes stop_codon:yes gene_type:complete